MKRRIPLWPLACGLLAAATAHGQELPSYEAYQEAPRLTRAAPADATLPFQARVASLDEQRNVPTFVWTHRTRTPKAPHATAEAAARWYLGAMAGPYRLTKAALDSAYVHRVHDIGRGGIIVTFRQTIAGVEVHRNELDVLLDRDLRMVAISGNLHEAADAAQVTRTAKFQIDHATALTRALRDLYGVTVSTQGLGATSWQFGGYRHFELQPGGEIERAGIRFTMPARVKPVYYPMPDRLVPAYFLEVFASLPVESSDDVYGYVIAADTGVVLARRNLTLADTYQYRVYADTDGLKTPLDGPQEDYTPHPTGVPGLPEPGFVDPVLIDMEGFNTSPSGLPDPWLPPGAVETRGNNVDAYADHFAPNGFTAGVDRRAAVTAPGVFDYLYDHELEPIANTGQVQAAVTQIFYTNNWLHDYFYDSGFTEAAGNAQLDNLGRGGLGNDILRAEAQDTGPSPANRNNANMSTPADGASPRMQMYLWNTPDIAHSFEAFGQSFEFNRAFFGAQEYVLLGNLVLASDGAGAPTDACEPLVGDVTGAVVLIDRGTCTFASKALRAQQAGAAAVIIANNVTGGPPTMPNIDPPLPITIPTIGMSLETGAALKALLAAGASDATLESDLDTERDGTIDNAIVAHEWGHYIHNRLVDCGNAQCGAQGEGWGDFLALHMMLREGDDYLGTYAMSIYATLRMGDNAYFGIRRAPYSVDPTRNAYSFRHISDGVPLPSDQHPFRPNGRPNSEVHAAGEVWASMMFEGYVALLQQTEGPTPRYSFDEAKRRMADYVVAGMMLAPSSPTYTEQRDGVLAAALARDPADMLLLAEAFARRGAGSCSTSPERNSGNFTGVVEDATVRAVMRVGAAAIDDSFASCDGDGVLDAAETGMVTVTVENPSLLELAGTELTLSTSTPGVSFPAGAALPVDTVPPFGATTLQVPVSLDPGATDTFQVIDVTLTLTNPTTCQSTLAHAALARGNFDLGPGRRDDAEGTTPLWRDVATVGVPGAWRRAQSDQVTGARLYHGDARGTSSDVSFVSPRLFVSGSEPFVVTFEHRYAFESGTSNFDGGVIEISTDGGVTFRDVATMAKPGYTGAIAGGASNVLTGRQGFVGSSPGYPALQPVRLDFGKSLAGNNVVLRFRIGTDNGVGTQGWDIDTIEVSGTINQPFQSLVADQSACAPNLAPIASAGPDLVVASGSEVILDASGSTDPEGRDISFAWAQSAGPEVPILAIESAIVSFTAPVVTEDTVLRFDVSVVDGALRAIDSVDVTVLAPVVPPDEMPDPEEPGPPDPIDPEDPGDPTPEDPEDPENPGNPVDPTPDGPEQVGGGGGCSAGTSGDSSGSLPAVLALGALGVLVLRRRQRRV
jgi:MYXO-CTERM domain-containing protein